MTPSAQRGVFGVSYHSKRQRAAEPRKKPKRQRSPERFKREAVRPLLAVEAYARTATAAGPAVPGSLPRSGRERNAGRSPFCHDGLSVAGDTLCTSARRRCPKAAGPLEREISRAPQAKVAAPITSRLLPIVRCRL